MSKSRIEYGEIMGSNWDISQWIVFLPANFTGKPHISWENHSGFQFSDFPKQTNPLNMRIDYPLVI